MTALIRTATLAAAAGSMVTYLALPAHANPYGNDATVNGQPFPYPDDRDHDYFLDNLIPQHVIAMDYAMQTRLGVGTNMTVAKRTGQTGDTDVIARDAYYGTNYNPRWDGRWTCWEAYNVGGEIICDRGFLELNQSANFVGDDGIRSSKVTAHEAGHSVGLIHSSQLTTCMYPSAESANTSDYDGHEKGHINARFP